jgi:hypothetical protein
MKISKLAAIILLALTVGLWTRAGMALELEDGFFDIPWGGYITQLKGFEPLEQNLEVSYYVKPDRTYQIENIEVTNVVYGFYADRFFAVYIAIDGIDVFGQLKKYIIQKYGDPRIEMDTKAQQNTYSWKHQQVKIKMKIREHEGDMKLSFYYMPLTGKANRAQSEAFVEPPKALFPLSAQKEREAVEHFNLLNF